MHTLNWHVLRVFSVVLVLTGVLGFLLPADRSPTSGAAPYNVFHIAFGLLGVGLAALGRELPIRSFNIGFGLIDLYQAAASLAGLFPAAHFRWKRADDVIHVVIGLGLLAVGAWRGRSAGPR